MTDSYTGRHRTPSRAERRAAQRRRRTPKSFGPGYALPTAAAATLVLSAAGATAAQTTFGAVPATAAQGAFQTSAAGQGDEQASRASVSDLARGEHSALLQDQSSLDRRRQDSSGSVAADQGRAQESKRAARAAERREHLEWKKNLKKIEERREAAAARKAERQAAPEAPATSTGGNGATTGATGSSSAGTGTGTGTGSGGWVQPLTTAVFTSPYGHRWGRLHAGQDYAAAVGTPLRAMNSGTVKYAGTMDGYGNVVDIVYADGTMSRYGHMDSISVSVGQAVSSGQVVGAAGNTGRSTGPHLHLEIHPGGGGAVDPAPWLAAHGLGMG